MTATPSLFFEDFSVGQAFRSARPREVSPEDIDRFGQVSGDLNPLHFDSDFARRSGFGGRIAHGLLALSIASGLLHELGIVRETVLAFRSLEWKFKSPVAAGDSLRLSMEVTGKKPAGGRGGLVVFKASLSNQRGLAVQEGAWSLLVRGKEAR